MDATFPQRDVASYYLGLLTSTDHLASFPVDRLESQSAETFLAETDYSRAAIAVLHDRRSSSHPNLELDDIHYEGRSVSVTARYPGSGGTADITTDTLIVRVPLDETLLRGARVTLHPQHGEPAHFSTANLYDVHTEFDPAGDLVLRNRDCANNPLTVTVTYQGDLFYRDGMDLQPASLRRIPGVFLYPGEWTVAVRHRSETIERSWSLTDAPPGDVLIDVAGDGTVSLGRRAEGVSGGDLQTCDTNAYPYESPDPSENLDRPVGLWIVDQSKEAHSLTVTISDNATQVFSDEFDLQEGYDKIHRAGLLAKKTTYAIDVTIDTGRSVSQSVTILKGTEQLEVRITESGGLALSVT